MSEPGHVNAILVGAVDLHYHSAPSPFPRRLDPAQAALHYEEAGFRAVVLKSHHHNTVMDILRMSRSPWNLGPELRAEVYGIS